MSPLMIIIVTEATGLRNHTAYMVGMIIYFIILCCLILYFLKPKKY
jgi:hypothetical protein